GDLRERDVQIWIGNSTLALRYAPATTAATTTGTAGARSATTGTAGARSAATTATIPITISSGRVSLDSDIEECGICGTDIVVRTLFDRASGGNGSIGGLVIIVPIHRIYTSAFGDVDAVVVIDPVDKSSPVQVYIYSRRERCWRREAHCGSDVGNELPFGISIIKAGGNNLQHRTGIGRNAGRRKIILLKWRGDRTIVKEHTVRIPSGIGFAKAYGHGMGRSHIRIWPVSSRLYRAHRTISGVRIIAGEINLHLPVGVAQVRRYRPRLSFLAREAVQSFVDRGIRSFPFVFGKAGVGGNEKIGVGRKQRSQAHSQENHHHHQHQHQHHTSLITPCSQHSSTFERSRSHRKPFSSVMKHCAE